MKVTVIPIVIDALCTVIKRFMQGYEDLEIRGRVETTQTSALRSTRIQKKVLETWGDLLSLKFLKKNPSANPGVKNSQKSKIMMKIIIVTSTWTLPENWKNMEHESDGDTNCNWYAWNDFQRLGKMTFHSLLILTFSPCLFVPRLFF